MFLGDSIKHLQLTLEHEYNSLLMKHHTNISYNLNKEEYTTDYGKIDLTKIEIFKKKFYHDIYSHEVDFDKCVAFDVVKFKISYIWPIHSCTRSSNSIKQINQGRIPTKIYDFGDSDTIILDNYCNLWIFSLSEKLYKLSDKVPYSTIPICDTLIDHIKHLMSNFISDDQQMYSNGQPSFIFCQLTPNINYCKHIIDTVTSVQQLAKHYYEKFVQFKPLFDCGNVLDIHAIKTELDIIKKSLEVRNAEIIILSQSISDNMNHIDTLKYAYNRDVDKLQNDIIELNIQNRKLRNELTHYITL